MTAVVVALPGMWTWAAGARTSAAPKQAGLTWAPTRPEQAVLTIQTTRWVVDIDVLINGLDAPTAGCCGDFFVTPALVDGRHEIVLDNGSLRGALHVDTADLAVFVDAVRVARGVSA